MALFVGKAVSSSVRLSDEIGNATVNIVPRPKTLCTVIWPP
jgi:hypothetical protein